MPNDTNLDSFIDLVCKTAAGTVVALSPVGIAGGLAFAGFWWLCDRAASDEEEKQKKYAHIKWEYLNVGQARGHSTQGVTYFETYDAAKEAYDRLKNSTTISFELCRATGG